MTKWGWKAKKDERWLFWFDHEGQDVFIIKCEAVLEDSMVPNVEEQRSNVFVKNLNVQFTNEDISILEKIRNVLLKEKDFHHWGELRSIDYWRLLENSMRLWIRLKLEISQNWMISYMLVLQGSRKCYESRIEKA